MGKSYNNGLPVGTGLKIESATPVDDRMYVDTFADLSVLSDKYDGMAVRVKDEGFKTYIFDATNDTFIPENQNISSGLLSKGKLTITDNDYLFEVDDVTGLNYSWKINNQTFVNGTTEITIDFAESGKERLDLFFVGTTNGIQSRSGIEVNVGELVPEPILNPNEIKIGLVKVTDSTTGIPAPISTEDFVRRSFGEIIQPTITDGIISLSDFGGGQANFDIVIPNIIIKGFINTQSLIEAVSIFPGKEFVFRNNSGAPVKLWHGFSQLIVEINLNLPESQDIIIPNKGIITLDYNENIGSLEVKSANFYINPKVEITPVAGVINSTPNMNNKKLIFNVGADDAVFNVLHPIEFSFLKVGTGELSFVEGPGLTLIGRNSTLRVFSEYSVGIMEVFGNICLLFVNDNYDLNFLKLENLRFGFIQPDDFIRVTPGTNWVCNILFAVPLADSNYFPDATFPISRPGWTIYNITENGFTLDTQSTVQPTQVVRWKAIRTED